MASTAATTGLQGVGGQGVEGCHLLPSFPVLRGAASRLGRDDGGCWEPDEGPTRQAWAGQRGAHLAGTGAGVHGRDRWSSSVWDTGHQGGPEGAVSAGDFQVACSCHCVSGSPEQVSPPAGPGGVPAMPAAPRRGQRRGPSSSWAGGRLGGPGPWAPGQGWAALMLWLCPPQSWGSPGGPARWRTWSSSCASGPRGSRLGEVGVSLSAPSCGQGTCPPVHTPPGGTGAGNAGDLQGEPRVPWVCGDGAPSASTGTSELRALVTPGPLPCPSPGSQSFDQVPEVVYREVKDVTPGGPSAGRRDPAGHAQASVL